MSATDGPATVCRPCGMRLGWRPPGLDATWHFGACDRCGEVAPVTELRDFGGPVCGAAGSLSTLAPAEAREAGA